MFFKLDFNCKILITNYGLKMKEEVGGQGFSLVVPVLDYSEGSMFSLNILNDILKLPLLALLLNKMDTR